MPLFGLIVYLLLYGSSPHLRKIIDLAKFKVPITRNSVDASDFTDEPDEGGILRPNAYTDQMPHYL
ncbi:hypothetical protein T265_01603 [Opisthorchis viverrini]|uniref:Uncharacterized protein n=1 Tax=Opisthorchis viverrini TaxID=6198 RepID=A0A075A9G5_OPIVI|nr:hypothetical protein T265_01603 [Opisthorchis viverrini]KER32380.1 hypothetical protein T265_01603 [Opisthorchis viverrini]